MASELTYLERRLADERAAVLSTTDPMAREAHLELSRLYELRLRALHRHDSRIQLTSA